MSDLVVSDISIEPIPNYEGLIGFTNFVINNDFKICNVGIHTCLSSCTGIRLVFPQREYKGKKLDTIYPVNSSTYEVLSVAIANAYRELMEKLR